MRLGIRIGVNTGEVIVGDRAKGEPSAAGAAVKIAKQIQEAAAEGEILIGQATSRLVAGAVQIEPAERGNWEGAGAIDAARLVDVLPPGSPPTVSSLPLAAGGPRATARSSLERVLQHRSRRSLSPLHGARVGGRGKVTLSGGVRRTARRWRHRAGGAMPAVRRGDHLLAAC